MAKYGSLEYWDNRYTNDSEPFEWYQSWGQLKNILQENGLKLDQTILNIGCGNSEFSFQMANDGYQSITNVDYSTVCVQQMKEKYAHVQQLTYEQGDVTNMSNYSNHQFEVVIDKGTLDSIFCGEDSGRNSQAMLKEVHRVLKPNGFYINISYGDPSTRLVHLQAEGLRWEVSYKTIKKPYNPFTMTGSKETEESYHYIYFCRKSQSKN